MMPRLFYTLIVVLALSGCDQTPVENPSSPESATNIINKDQPVDDNSVDPVETVSATMLAFQESEEGIEPYMTRMLVTEEYVRIDEADSADGYVLYDRKHRRIYSVLHESEQILVVDPSQPLTATPDSLKLTDKVIEDNNVPAVGGIKPKHYQFYANETLCYDVIAIDGFLPKVTAVLEDYQKVLAAQQQKTIALTPPELQTPCFLANYVYAASSYMSKGFPFEQWNVEGYRRTLVDFEEGKMVDKKLFSLPEGYGFFSLGGDVGSAIIESRGQTR